MVGKDRRVAVNKNTSKRFGKATFESQLSSRSCHTTNLILFDALFEAFKKAKGIIRRTEHGSVVKLDPKQFRNNSGFFLSFHSRV